MKHTLVFVYNADSGLFSLLSDWAHKVFSPATYPCRLCALTYSHIGMRREWQAFLRTLERPTEFLHADELKTRYGLELPLPAVLEKRGETLVVLIDRATLETCATLADLQGLLLARLERDTPA